MLEGPAKALAATGDVVEFDKALQTAKQLEQIDAKLADRIALASKMRTGFNDAAKNLLTHLKVANLGGIATEIGKMAYYSIREGLASFDQFLILIKGSYVKANLLKVTANFTPEQLAMIKKAWQEGLQSAEKGVVYLEGIWLLT